MVGRTDARFAILHALKITGRAGPGDLVERSGMAVDHVEEVLVDLARTRLIEHHDGSFPGWSLTSDGRQEHAAALAAEPQVGGIRRVLEEAYACFLEHNETFKALCTAWQLRSVGHVHAPNDHRDRSYDFSIVEQLTDLHEAMAKIIRDLAQAIERFGYYEPRFTKALVRLRAGDVAALARPMSGSYHDVWMELHQDLLDTLGLPRSPADGN